ncbi:TonB-dependent receptor SusC [termite gut metagenome]|uniref:TonB-dependent receptor SusC n=1 Tax=termite gut metagenome TaxID=433724 RepID=A0A5J4SKH0_9ZZZZ
MANLIKNFQTQTFFSLFVVFFSIYSPVFSQTSRNGKIEGVVLDETTHTPITGAFITLSDKGGAVSNEKGYFSVFAESFPATLSISFLGYKTVEQIVDSPSKSLQILLQENAELLNEVVVVGYGTQRRKELTGSVASVSQSVIKRNNALTIDGLLGGTVAGVNLTQSSGQPGATSSIRIRGGNSIHASNDPLYVIDGFIYFSETNATFAGISAIESNLNPLVSLNPSDIESIEILKDVSAKAIYGSRGANGVILVTTKKGNRNKNTIHYKYSVGIDKTAKKLDLLTAQQWLKIQKDYFNDKPSQYYSREELSQFDKGTDWQNAVLQTGYSQTHDFSVSGGDDNTRYLISGNYTNQNGTVLNSGFERLGSRLNIERKLFENLNVNLSFLANRSSQRALTTFENTSYGDSPFSNGIANSLTYALYMPPVLPIYNADGSYNYKNPFEYTYMSWNEKSANPVSDLKNSIGKNISTSLLGNFFVEYNIIDGLKAKIIVGANVDYITQNLFAPPYTALGFSEDRQGKGAIGNRRTDVTQSEFLLSYTKLLNPNHFVDLLAGYTWQKTATDFVISQAHKIDSFNNLAAGISMPSISRFQNALFRSLLGRVNYTFLSRYNLTATYRADYSSRFAKGYEWSYFPSVGMSWNVNQEKFLKSFDPTLSNLKLRLTFGKAGNQEIDYNEYEEYFNIVKYDGETAYQLTTLNNKNLKWETTTEYNFGVDVGFLKNRLSFVADVYYKKTHDLLLKIPPPFASGTTQKQLKNIGNVSNRGFEFTVNATPIESSRLTWQASANFAWNINKITNLGKYNNLTTGREQEEILQVGESVGSFYGYIFEGVVQKSEDNSGLPIIGSGVPKPGDAKFKDVSGENGSPDGKIDTSFDRVVLGSVQPDFIYGLSSTINFGAFDFFVLFQGSEGNELYNKLRRFLERPDDVYNRSSALLNSWTEENPSNTLTHIRSTRIFTLDSRYVEDASFLKLRNVTLGYTIPMRINKLISTIRVFAAAQNLYTWTRYQGYDPEVASGTDLGVYPATRSFLGGITITF